MVTLFQKKNFWRNFFVVLSSFILVYASPLLASSTDKTEASSKDENSQQTKEIKKDDSSKKTNGVDLLSNLSSGSNLSTQETLPEVILTNDLLFQILSADIAEQRGLDAYAYQTMMDVANKTKDSRLARRAAEIAVKNRNLKESLQAVRLWHQLAPDSKDAEKYWLGFLLLDNRLDEVRDYFSSRLAGVAPEERGALFFQLQRVLAGANDKTDAFAVLEELTAPYQNMSEAHIVLAASALLKNDRERAREEAQKALVLKPDSELAVLTYAQMSSGVSEAVKILSTFLAENPDSREVRLALARLLVGQKKYESAKKEFAILLNSDPKDLMALYSLGLLSIQEKDYVSSEKYFKTYLDISSELTQENEQDSMHVRFLLSQIAEDQHQYDKALQWLSQIDTDDDNKLALELEVRKAQIYAKKGNINKARKMITDLANENPYEWEKLLLIEAQILKDVKKTKEALNVLKSGIIQFPQNTTILYDYALTAENLGQYEVMEEALKQIIEIDPHHQQAYNALGYSLADRNIRLDEAYVLIDKANKLAPDDPYITDSLGWVLFRQGEFDLAEQNLRRAYMLRHDNEIAVHLAEVLWVKGERQQARELFLEVKRNDPENELLSSTLARLKIKL